MSKMRKEYDPNKVKRRKRKPIVYIICEGKETETLYFKHFRSRNCLVDIIPIPSKHKAAQTMCRNMLLNSRPFCTFTEELNDTVLHKIIARP